MCGLGVDFGLARSVGALGEGVGLLFVTGPVTGGCMIGFPANGGGDLPGGGAFPPDVGGLIPVGSGGGVGSFPPGFRRPFLCMQSSNTTFADFAQVSIEFLYVPSAFCAVAQVE